MAKDDITSIAGLPEELGIDEDLARAEQQVSVRVESRRYGKPMTIVDGLDGAAIDLKGLASELKKQLATGGTVEDDRIELQGDHAARLPKLLEEHGFTVRN